MVKDVNKVILITQDVSSIPFDISSLRCIPYTQTIAGDRKVKSDLANAIIGGVDLHISQREGESPLYSFKVHKRKTFKFPIQLFGENNYLYDFELFGDAIGANGAKLLLQVTKYAAGTIVYPKKWTTE